MKITKSQLKQIIKEELEQALGEFEATNDFQIPESPWGWENAPGEYSMSTATGYKGQAPQPGTYTVDNNVSPPLIVTQKFGF